MNKVLIEKFLLSSYKQKHQQILLRFNVTDTKLWCILSQTFTDHRLNFLLILHLFKVILRKGCFFETLLNRTF